MTESTADQSPASTTPWAATMRRKPPSVDTALQRGHIKSWIWMPQASGPPLVEVYTLRGRCLLLPEAEAEAFAEGVLIGADDYV